MKKNDNNDKDIFLEKHNPPIETSIEDFVNTNGISYAHYTLTDRAIISNDGLKPVQRRILYTMHQLGLKPGSRKIKGSKITSDTTGNYHPHGPMAVEPALARLGQTFVMRVPLLDVQGSLGTFTGDVAANGRYFEASLNKNAYELVKDIDNKACKMVYTETGDNLEPFELPINFPIGIINGTEGIGVGWASNIAPHNPDEVMNCCIAYFQGKIKKDEDILKYIQGPDFPTGGEIFGIDGIKEYLLTGRGKFFIRGKYTLEDLPRGRTKITFYELPYQVSAENIIERINSTQSDKKKLLEISEAKDLSDKKKGLNLCIYVKSGSDITKVISDLWKYTPCQNSFNVNSVVLINGVPNENTSMYQLIEQFCLFKKFTFKRKTEYKIQQNKKESHKLAGILNILLDIKKAVKIIQESDSEDIAVLELKKSFKIDDEQAEYILSMPLRRIVKSNRENLKIKKDNIDNEIKEFENVLNNESLMYEYIIKELKDTLKVISDKRRTTINGITHAELEEESKLLAKQDRILSKDAEVYIKVKNKCITKSFEDNKGIKTSSLNNVFGIDEQGNSKQITVENIPLNSELPLSKIKNDIIDITGQDYYTLVISDKGNGNIISKDNILKEGKFATLLPDEKIINVFALTEEDINNKYIILVNNTGDLIKIKLSLIRIVNKQGAGLINIAKMENELVKSAIVSDEDIIKFESQNEVKYVQSEDCPSKGKGGKGYLVHKLKKDDNIIDIEVFTELPKNAKISLRATKGEKKN